MIDGLQISLDYLIFGITMKKNLVIKWKNYFRGTNGSGKSVTTQSFIPLLLDGDKRPSRLDPFGSVLEK